MGGVPHPPARNRYGIPGGSIKLKDGRAFEQVAIVAGYITQVRNHAGIPFEAHEIVKIEVNHKRWDFNADRAKQRRNS
jgi:hypothetical protein